METLIEALARHSANYPAMQPADAVKLVFQNEFGGAHLLRDPETARARLHEEWETVPEDASAPLSDPIGNGMTRVSLAAWKASGRTEDELFALFLRSARDCRDSVGSFREKISLLRERTARGELPFSIGDLDAFLRDYPLENPPATAHSEAFRAAYRPSYRVVRCEDLSAFCEEKENRV